jgi:hypothetical protein
MNIAAASGGGSIRCLQESKSSSSGFNSLVVVVGPMMSFQCPLYLYLCITKKRNKNRDEQWKNYATQDGLCHVEAESCELLRELMCCV